MYNSSGRSACNTLTHLTPCSDVTVEGALHWYNKDFQLKKNPANSLKCCRYDEEGSVIYFFNQTGHGDNNWRKEGESYCNESLSKWKDTYEVISPKKSWRAKRNTRKKPFICNLFILPVLFILRQENPHQNKWVKSSKKKKKVSFVGIIWI